MWTPLAIVPLALASGSVGSAYEAGLRAELRSRPSGSRGADLELVPALALEHTHETLTLAVRYAPRLLISVDAGAPGLAVTSPNVLHVGALEATWALSPISQLRAVEQVSYGVNQFDPLSASDPADPLNGEAPGLEGRPLTSVPRYLSTDTGLAWSRALSLRTRLSLGARYQVSGSLAEEARAALPLQHGPSAEARLSHDLTRRDQLETVASATQTTFSTDESALTVTLAQGWRRQLAHALDGELALGGAALRSTSPAQPAAGTRALPVAAASLGYAPQLSVHPLTLRAAARYAPFIDRVSGEAYGRAEGDLALAWSPHPWVQLGSRAGLARALQSGAGQGNTLATLEAGATFQKDKALALSAGVRGAWDRRTLADGTALRRFDAGAFLTLTLLTHEAL
ncbi:hypothetical protein FGE12_09300 [Aggregicoccus sp. 17bor-14]|uniref:hypothetical protein n=1 Tax=Myxococcaceae TaxID=31 RepID=UPI00129C5DC3|nr:MULTISPECIES: hypothetical protein [Myxococcaceae]MBF5042594.1 hypothetical protein [Simulacricoccus sp. 17bor-14]MRI88363.1 hypothetical protein [Aggregicoccus sp. 17bor-14]